MLLLLDNSEETVLKKVDSLLYENIPGKILRKQRSKKMDTAVLISPTKHGVAICNVTIFLLRLLKY